MMNQNQLILEIECIPVRQNCDLVLVGYFQFSSLNEQYYANLSDEGL